MAFGTWTLTRAADQYNEFAKSHVGNLRAEIAVQGKELVQMVNRLAKQINDEQTSGANARLGYDKLQSEIAELKGQLEMVHEDLTALTAQRKKRL
jgi:peptidoglycan hydrolase CwlO-like protein